ncbi:PTS sugar transporter subunit IIB [Fervidibacillus halotolerans]|uniref:PTS sugar transporter subunit IIB n=1 Tax=Fervidibacillus halotolerans TaxID=2980027 RepID=A0A9E8LZ51_9BACI|nr:PTS sugar transporter subunit IIB [Fervidibacillus halotolerans]WAA12082.1 PTS sugar transporter subunit IIB [Fervidibacillus halotolerans]
MKILAICGSGLGSSFMLEMNIQQALSELGVDNIEVEHSDLSSATSDAADLFVMAKDIAEGASHLGERIVLESIIDQDELKTKLKSKLEEMNIL